jgi:hypothetical protein
MNSNTNFDVVSAGRGDDDGRGFVFGQEDCKNM